MKLEILLNSTQNHYLGYLERYVSEQKGSFKDYSEVNINYSPQEGLTEFSIPYKFLSFNECKIVEAKPSNELRKMIFKDDKVKFFWHPETTEKFNNPDGFLTVEPTSSTRTLLTKNLKYNFCIKTDLNKLHAKFLRYLREDDVIHSIAISNELEESIENNQIRNFGFLPESLGIIDLKTKVGVVFRELLPRPKINQQRILIPYFSLYSYDMNETSCLPLLIQIININTSIEPIQFFVDKIIGILFDSWSFCVFKRGIFPELHGQNALLEIDENGYPTRIIMRDFQSVFSDNAIRMSNALKLFHINRVGIDNSVDFSRQASLNFDHIITDYHLKKLVNTFIQYFPEYERQFVNEMVKNRFHQAVGEGINIFPNKVFKFAKSNFSDNHSVGVIETDEENPFR